MQTKILEISVNFTEEDVLVLRRNQDPAFSCWLGCYFNEFLGDQSKMGSFDVCIIAACTFLIQIFSYELVLY